jgi:hypothetical protein
MHQCVVDEVGRRRCAFPRRKPDGSHARHVLAAEAKSSPACRRHLAAWDGALSDLDRQRSGGAWFPYGLLGALVRKLAAGPPTARDLGDQLALAVENHVRLAQQQSDVLEAGAAMRG